MKKIKIPFDLSKAQESNYEIETTDTPPKKVRILCTDILGEEEEIAVAIKISDNEEKVTTYHKDGHFFKGHDSEGDLVLMENQFEDGDFVHSDKNGSTYIINTKNEWNNSSIAYYFQLKRNNSDYDFYGITSINGLRLATNEEKQKVLDRLNSPAKSIFEEGNVLHSAKMGWTLIVKTATTDILWYHCLLYTVSKVLSYDNSINNNNVSDFVPATEEQRQELFDALQKENKTWDAKNVYLKVLNYKFEPFERVLVREAPYEIWRANIFSHYYEDEATTIDNLSWDYILPYNEDTKDLLGTTKSNLLKT